MAQDTQVAPSTPQGQQWCTRCERYRDLGDFSPSARGKNGEWCKPCRNAYNRERNKAKPFRAPVHDEESLTTLQQWCPRCEQDKTLAEFQPSRRGKTGAWCRACDVSATRERRGKTYDTDPALPKAAAVIAECSMNGCTYVGELLRGMCRKHYALWQKKNTNVSWFTDIGMICNRCDLDKPLEEFPVDKNAKCGYRPRCKSCCRLDQKESYLRDPTNVRARAKKQHEENGPAPYNSERRKQRYLMGERSYRLMKEFGITEEEYDELFAAQGNCCAICKRPDNTSKDRKMPVDHIHDTGQRRGIICGNCNVGIGMLGDDPDRLMAAATYLLQYTDVLN